MAFSTAGTGPFRAEMNLTPMIDVLLVLIIIFMVAVSSAQKKGLATEIPNQPINPVRRFAPSSFKFVRLGSSKFPRSRSTTKK
jgi:biopolymer transport protein ExbD